MSKRIIEDIYVYKAYQPKKRKIVYMDLNCLEIIRRVIKEKPNTTHEDFQKSILQILKEDHYQLVYFDGHVPEFTQYLYEVIINTVDVDHSTNKFCLFLCELLYWCKEYYILIDEKTDDIVQFIGE